MKFKYSKPGFPFAAAALLAFSAALPALADYPATVLSQGPVGYWRLEETTPPPPTPFLAINTGSVGSAGNGVYSNTVTRGVPGIIAGDPSNTAARFPGPVPAGNRIRVPYASQWNQTGPYSVEFWARPGQTDVLACPAASVEFIATPAQRNGWLIYQGDNATLNTGNGFIFRQYNSTGLAVQSGVGVNMTLSTNQWYHIVGTFDGTSLRLYINGALAGTTAIAGTARNNTNSSIPLTFGARADGASGFFEYNGDLDECAVYTSALSGARVLAHYQSGTNPTPVTAYSAEVANDSPVGYWRLSEPGDPAAINAGTLGAVANGKYAANALPGQSGPRPSSTPVAFPGFPAANKATTFDGVVGSVTIAPLLLNTNRVTITGWIKPNGNQVAGAGVFQNIGTGGGGIQFDAVNGGLELGYTWNSDPLAGNWESFLTIPDLQWSFVALIVRPDYAVLYVPGQVPATNILTHAVVAFDGQSLIGNGAAAFNGSLDDVAIFNTSLGLGDVYSQYATAVGGLAPQLFGDPQGANVVVGDTLTLSVDVGGTPNLSYRWRKDGVPIPGATNNPYAKPGVVLGDAGSYDVIITNLFGSVTSGPATVTTETATAPVILRGPVGRSVYPGGTLNLNVQATGGGLKYQWMRSATNLPGATSSAYLVNVVSNGNAGSYTVSVTNSLGVTNLGPAVVTVPAPAAGSYAALVTADAPEAWWRLDDLVGTTGSRMLDSMGRHDGTYTNNGGLALGVAGAVSGGGTAASFNGDGSYGYVPFDSALNPYSFTLECWAKLPSVMTGIVPASSRGAGGGYAVGTVNSEWHGLIGGFYYGQPSGVTAGYDPSVHPGQWVHLVILSATGGQFPLQVFVNGVSDGYIWGDAARNTTDPFIIGGNGTGTSDILNSFMNGQVDEVAVYKRALSLAQIQAHYAAANSGVPPSFGSSFLPQTVTPGKAVSFTTTVIGAAPITLQWYRNAAPISGATNTSFAIASTVLSDTATYTLWATNSAGVSNQSVSLTVISPVDYFTDTNGSVLHLKFENNTADTSGHNNNGTAVGGPVFVPGIVGAQALQYTTITVTNGSSNPSNVTVSSASYVNLGTPADLQFGTSTSFTIGLWVKLSSGFSGGDLPFIGSGVGSMNNPGWDLGPTYGGGGWQWCLNDGVAVQAVTNNIDVSGPNSSINDGNWHNFVLVVDRSGHVADTYLDGVLLGVNNITGLASVDNGSSIVIGQDPTHAYATLSPASQNDLNVWGPTQTATLDDMGIWTRALTATEVAKIESAGRAGHSFDAVAPASVTLTITKSGANLTLSWSNGTLQQSDVIGTGAVWTTVPGATAPSYTFTPTGSKKFYRVLVQ